MEETIAKAVARIERMEACLDCLQNAFARDRSVCGMPWFGKQRRLLCEYYQSGLWLADYEADEKGLLPPGLKRGVLSQDAVYDFLSETESAFAVQIQANHDNKERRRAMIYQAHKGVSTENPENTMHAVTAAILQGYESIEADVAVTKDLQFVLLHDRTINRTAVRADGERLEEPVSMTELTYEQALQYDFGAWFSPKFKGTRIPLLREVLEKAAKSGVTIKIDNKYQSFDQTQREAFFDLLKPFEKTACLTCFDVKELESVSKRFPSMHVHYDGAVNAEVLERLSRLLPKERLTVWLPLKSEATSWVKVAFADKDLAERVKKVASLGVWILSRSEQLREAEALGADFIETNGQLKPLRAPLSPMLADMHTHSESSHDSVERIERMRERQREKGIGLFAVTDHFDTDSFTDYDVFTPIEKACKTARRLTADGDIPEVFAGVEISEGFWHPDVYEKVMGLCDYDVIIGSVHCVKYKELTKAYSKIDFSHMPEQTILEYIDAYFDDMMTMLDTEDFDVLAHLTCPLRYINGIYKRSIGIEHFLPKIDAILKTIINRGIALEVNTSSFDLLGDFMPSADLLKRYYDMGGYLITLGSDAHTAEQAARHFDKAVEVVCEIGFQHIYYYHRRRPFPLEIERRNK
ncbi:MAG: DUF4298 domain-containing protein [Ruminococcaceae bacterium]|nr:DUF4298 domain-containing protein [Oscillospiraceae bacterium]